MSLDWPTLIRKPIDFADGAASEAWFATLAETLLNRTEFRVAGQPHRLIEVEVYYHSPAHPDPFAHKDKVQLESGRWYFHRTHGQYRGGNFKGLDLAFGDGVAYGRSAPPTRVVVEAGGTGCRLVPRRRSFYRVRQAKSLSHPHELVRCGTTGGLMYEPA